MAEGFPDMGPLNEAFPSVSTTGGPAKAKQTHLEMKVLLWNIHGSSSAGSAECRNNLVPQLVKKASPDVLLLQETNPPKLVQAIVETDKLVQAIVETDKLVQAIVEENKAVKKYTPVKAKDEKESQVLYDSNIYEAVPNEQKIFPGKDGSGPISLKEAFDRSMPTGEGREVKGIKNHFNNRIAFVGLKRKKQELMPSSVQEQPERVTIFMSYHNVHTSKGADERNRGANGFYEMVGKMRELTGCVVVGGADLNQSITGDGVLPYEATPRREGKVIDYIILAAPEGMAWEPSVTALDFVGAEDDDSNPLQRLMKDLLRPPGDGGGKAPTIDQYSMALDHDPLVCDLHIQYP